MNDEKREKAKLVDDQAAAIAATTAIIVFFAIYWSLQIQSMLDLLELAYG